MTDVQSHFAEADENECFLVSGVNASSVSVAYGAIPIYAYIELSNVGCSEYRSSHSLLVSSVDDGLDMEGHSLITSARDR